MVGLETLQLGKSRDEEPWKVGTNNSGMEMVREVCALCVMFYTLTL